MLIRLACSTFFWQGWGTAWPQKACFHVSSQGAIGLEGVEGWAEKGWLPPSGHASGRRSGLSLGVFS